MRAIAPWLLSVLVLAAPAALAQDAPTAASATADDGANAALKKKLAEQKVTLSYGNGASTLSIGDREFVFTTAPADEEGYKKNESQGLDQLIQGTQGQQQQSSPPPDNQEQPDFGGQSNPN